MKVGVIGAGAWGTALANLLAAKGEETTIWAYEPEVAEEINAEHVNSLYLADMPLDARLKATADLDRAVQGAEVVVMVTPSHVARQVAGELAPALGNEALVVTASKGIEADTLLTMTGVLENVLGADCRGRLAVLSGPSFAKEVAQGRPTAVTVASRSHPTAEAIQKLFMTERFRVYTTHDVTGVELGGALKNVMAIAAGIGAGMDLGHNAAAALITRGLAEISRLGVKMGADPLTFAGLAGVGDLVLTCTGGLSRNRTVGMRLGRGEKIEDILASTRTVAEGVKTTKSAHQLAQKMAVEMPICALVYDVLYEGVDVATGLSRLMGRDAKVERWGLD